MECKEASAASPSDVVLQLPACTGCLGLLDRGLTKNDGQNNAGKKNDGDPFQFFFFFYSCRWRGNLASAGS